MLKALGGESQKIFETPLGKRVVDQFSDFVINESKVGYKYLTEDIKLQIAKDVEIVRAGEAIAAKWWFFKSPKTGKVGGSEPLKQELDLRGIEFEIVE